MNDDSQVLPTYTISALLRRLKPEDVDWHNIADYAAAMENFPELATSIINVGGDVIAVALAGGDILKITARDMPDCDRDFDMPILKKGTLKVKHVKVNYFVQPPAKPVSESERADFVKAVARQGYWFEDIGRGNVMFYPEQNRIVLVDPWAVKKMP